MVSTKVMKHLMGLGVALGVMAAPAYADEKKFYLQAGIGHIDLSNSFSDFTIGGTVDPTADAKVTDPTSMIINGGYMVRDNWSVSFTGGIPVTSDASGAGSISALGGLGSITFGVAGLSLNHHFKTGGKLQPFIGAGLAYGIVFDAEDGALTNVKVDNEFGTEIRAGFDYMITDQYGAYFAVSKAFLEFNIEGMAGPAPASVKAKLDPLLIQTGVTYRF